MDRETIMSLRIELRTETDNMIKALKTKAGKMIRDRIAFIDTSKDEGKQKLFETCLDIVNAYIENIDSIKMAR